MPQRISIYSKDNSLNEATRQAGFLRNNLADILSARDILSF
jgi:hypothetical protein